MSFLDSLNLSCIYNIDGILRDFDDNMHGSKKMMFISLYDEPGSNVFTTGYISTIEIGVGTRENTFYKAKYDGEQHS